MRQRAARLAACRIGPDAGPTRAAAVVGRIAAGLAVVVVAGCGGGGDEPRPQPTATPGSPAERPEPSDEELVAELLRDRAAALDAGNARTYAATAAGGQRRRDRVAARRAARLRLTDVELEAGTVRVDGRRATVRVATSYGIAGVRGAFVGRRRARLARTADGWRVRAFDGRRGLPPWEVAAFARRRSPHFVVLAPPQIPVDELLGSLESGYGTMREVLGGVRLRRRYLVVVAADAAQARALTIAIRGIESLAALVDASVLQVGPAQRTSRVGSLRLLVVWPAFESLDAVGRTRVVTHELTHAALAPTTSGRTPAWLAEGVALYVSGDRRPAPAGADLAALSRPDAIARLTGSAQAAAYETAAAAAFAIADRYGHRRLLALYHVFNQSRLRGRPGPRLVDRALRRELGITLADLEAQL